MPYAGIAAIVAAALAIHFWLAVDATYRAKAIVLGVLFVGLLIALFAPGWGIVGTLILVILAISLLLHARYRG